MDIVSKIRGLCDYRNISITKLEVALGYGNGSLSKSSTTAMRSDRIRDISNYFGVTPDYLLNDIDYTICTVCGMKYDPIDEEDDITHALTHENFIKLKEKCVFLYNPSESYSKRTVSEYHLKEENLSEDGKVFWYEILLQCDYSDLVSNSNYKTELEYSHYAKMQISNEAHFELLSDKTIKLLLNKYGVTIKSKSVPEFEKDKEFMEYINRLWKLPEQRKQAIYEQIDFQTMRNKE